MNKNNKVLALLCAVILTLSLTACRNYTYGSESRYKTHESTDVGADSTLQADDTGSSSLKDAMQSQKPSDANTDTAPSQGPSDSDEQTAPPQGEDSSHTIDYVKLINTISTDTIKACVNITLREYNTNWIGAETSYQTSLGSGVIFSGSQSSDGTYIYYVLTNHHVIAPSGNYTYYKYTIADYQGRQYTTVQAPKTDSATDALCESYDLGVLAFKSSTELKIAEFAHSDPTVGQTLVSVGQPYGQHNAITMGVCANYGEVKFEDGSPLVFDALHHTCPIDHGNSGGAIFNDSLELAGINFAGAWDKDHNFLYGYGVPIESVVKFLEEYGFTSN